MFKSTYDNSTHYSRESDGIQHGVAVALPSGEWHAILSVGVGQATEATVHATRWQAERKLEGFHTITEGALVKSRDDVSTTWRDRSGVVVALIRESAPGLWEVETFFHNGTRLRQPTTRTKTTREDAETWVSRNFF